MEPATILKYMCVCMHTREWERERERWSWWMNLHLVSRDIPTSVLPLCHGNQTGGLWWPTGAKWGGNNAALNPTLKNDFILSSIEQFLTPRHAYTCTNTHTRTHVHTHIRVLTHWLAVFIKCEICFSKTIGEAQLTFPYFTYRNTPGRTWYAVYCSAEKQRDLRFLLELSLHIDVYICTLGSSVGRRPIPDFVDTDLSGIQKAASVCFNQRNESLPPALKTK